MVWFLTLPLVKSSRFGSGALKKHGTRKSASGSEPDAQGVHQPVRVGMRKSGWSLPVLLYGSVEFLLREKPLETDRIFRVGSSFPVPVVAAFSQHNDFDCEHNTDTGQTSPRKSSDSTSGSFRTR